MSANFRNEPGTARAEWNQWGELAFDAMDGTFNVQQWIQQCTGRDPSRVDLILECPAGIDEGVWKYEHLRQFCLELNGLALMLQVGGKYFLFFARQKLLDV